MQDVQDALTSLDLSSSWNSFPVDFTFCSPSDTAFSTIDHFLYSEDLEELVSEAGVIHLGDNVPGHSPIYLKLNTETLPEQIVQLRQYSAKQNWRKATTSVSENLGNVEIQAAVIDCYNVNCTDPVHRVNIDKYTIDIIKCVESAAEEHIPYTRSKPGKPSSKRKSIPGWVEMVKPQQEKARFWYQVWLSADKPRAGQLFNIMRFTRNQYRYARKKCLKAVEATKRNKFIEASLMEIGTCLKN